MIPQGKIILNSPGPVADAFLNDDSFLSICLGPVGSGKTLTMLQKGLRLGAMQKGRPDKNGVLWRRARFGVLRESYPNIDKNILPSWFRLVPQSHGKFNWKPPYTHRFRKVLTGTVDRPTDILDMEYEFQAIGDKSVEEIMRGWEVTGFGVDEADLQSEDIVSFGAGRVGRFSDFDSKSVVNPQIILVSNMPWTDNWLYRLGVANKADGIVSPDLQAALGDRKLIGCFIQPGGRTRDAENLHNLRDGYYSIQVAVNTHKPGYVARMIDNKPTPPMHGQAVYPDFKHHLHVAPSTLIWDRNRKLVIGIDQGLNACALYGQFTERGQARILDETVFFGKNDQTLAKIGPTAFGKAIAQKLRDRFPDLRAHEVIIVADPAAFSASDRADQEFDWVMTVQAQLPKGMIIRPARTNSPVLRQDAVRKYQCEIDGYLIDPCCHTLIAAQLGGYHFAKADLSNNEKRGHIEVANTNFTHIADAEQYFALEGGDIQGMGVIHRVLGLEPAHGSFDLVDDFNDFGDF
jgi:hypothetical protein